MCSQFGSELPVITCLLVVYPNGEQVWEPQADYLLNPTPGTWVLRDSRKVKAEKVGAKKS